MFVSYQEVYMSISPKEIWGVFVVVDFKTL